MRIAIDISPLKNGVHSFLHRVRGAGSYVENLKNSLIEFSFDNEYIFFTKGQELSKYLDIVHYPYFEPFFLTLPFRKHFKTVVNIHDLIPLVFPSHFPSGIRGKIKWQIQKLALKRVD